MAYDPFSSILSLLDANVACGARMVLGGARMVLGGDWAFRAPPPRQIKLFFVPKGQCWVRLDNVSNPILLKEGDAFLFSGKYSYELSSNLSLDTIDVTNIQYNPDDAVIYLCNKDEDIINETHILGAHIDFNSQNGNLLIDQIPHYIHLSSNTPEAQKAGWLITQLVSELNETQIGSSNSVAALVQMLFIQLMRNYLMNDDSIPSGWLRALGDKKIAPAIQLIHGQPSYNWGLPELAKACGMSRTAFAVHFKNVAGMPPLTYLTEWRIMIAERELKDGATMQKIASKIGYSSEAAFSSAFKRVKGFSPKFYREQVILNYQ